MHILTVVVGDVSCQTSDLDGSSSADVGNGQNFSKELGSGREVIVPTQPTTVGSIHVEEDVGELQLLDRIGDALLVSGGGVGAPFDTHVGNQVCE